MAKKYELKYLSEEFYKKYNPVDYPEIEKKKERPYMVMLIKIENNTFALPFRTNVKHAACYRFKNSSRNTQSSTGLDYSKAVVIGDSKYLGNAATIDNKEYVELNNKYYFIMQQFKSYLGGYKKFINGELNKYEAKKYQFSTLKYFHNELGIEAEKQIEAQSTKTSSIYSDKAYISRATLKKNARELAEKRSKEPALTAPSKKHDNSLE